MLPDHPDWKNYDWWLLGRDRFEVGDYGEALEAWLMVKPELLEPEHQRNVENDIQNNAIAPLNRLGERERIVEAYQHAIDTLNQLDRKPQAERVKQEARRLGYGG